ncbi:hypothetical protein NFI96_021803 [Prochilodus magdalenae]|nr:hypothetical protein NFI96_021803 [Prochilodus magdalenae]
MGRHFISQQDNDPKYTARRTKAWFKREKIKVLPWHSTENVWKELKIKVHKRSLKNLDNLEKICICSVRPSYPFVVSVHHIHPSCLSIHPTNQRVYSLIQQARSQNTLTTSNPPALAHPQSHRQARDGRPRWTSRVSMATAAPDLVSMLEHPHTAPADGAVGVEVEGHQAFWTCDNKPLILVLPRCLHTRIRWASPPRLKRDSSLKMTRCHSESLHDSLVQGSVEMELDGSAAVASSDSPSREDEQVDEHMEDLEDVLASTQMSMLP